MAWMWYLRTIPGCFLLCCTGCACCMLVLGGGGAKLTEYIATHKKEAPPAKKPEHTLEMGPPAVDVNTTAPVVAPTYAAAKTDDTLK